MGDKTTTFRVNDEPEDYKIVPPAAPTQTKAAPRGGGGGVLAPGAPVGTCRGVLPLRPNKRKSVYLKMILQ